jgi:hypothetical protein
MGKKMKKSEWIELASYLWFLKKMKQGKYEHIEELIRLVNAKIFTAGIEEAKVEDNDDEPLSKTLRNYAEENISTTDSSNSASIWK